MVGNKYATKQYIASGARFARNMVSWAPLKVSQLWTCIRLKMDAHQKFVVFDALNDKVAGMGSSDHGYDEVVADKRAAYAAYDDAIKLANAAWAKFWGRNKQNKSK